MGVLSKILKGILVSGFPNKVSGVGCQVSGSPMPELTPEH
jgi:hypothetical protein